MRTSTKRILKTASGLLLVLAVILLLDGIYKSKKIETREYYYRDINKGDYFNSEIILSVADKMKTQVKYNGISVTGYNCTLINNTGYEVTDWKVSFNYPAHTLIDRTEDTVYDLEDKYIITFRPDKVNKVIRNRENINFSFYGYNERGMRLVPRKIQVKIKHHAMQFKSFKAGCALVVLLGLTAFMHIFVFIRIKNIAEKQKWYGEIINQSFKTFANVIDAKDPETIGHSLRVAAYSRELFRRMGKTADEQERIYYIGLLHDIGKIGIPDSILQKPGQLTEEEYEKIKNHTVIGGNILKDFTAMPGIADGAKYHHEHYDGTGYPNGLKGEEIPLYARVICVADAYDVMSRSRCYSIAMHKDNIIQELKNCSGRQFEPEIVEYMLDMIRDGFAPLQDNAQYREYTMHKKEV